MNAPVNQSSVSASGHEHNWSDVSVHTYIKIGLLAVLFYWFFATEIMNMVHRWANDATWTHGFLIPLFSLYFLNQKKEQILGSPISPNWPLGLTLLFLCLLMYPLNVVQFKFFYGRQILIPATLGTMVFFMGGWKLIRYTWLPIGYLFFAIPLPDRLYAQMTIPLRKLAAEAAAIVLNVIPDMTAIVQGVVIEVVYRGKPLEPGLDVAEACSGMRLLMAFVALGVAMAYLHERPVWQRLTLLASTIPISIICNVIRVTITGLIYVLWDPQYAQGIYHDTLGLLMLPVAFGLYGGLAWLMSNLFVEEATVQPDIITRSHQHGGQNQ